MTLKNHSLSKPAAQAPINLDTMSDKELLAMRHDIDQRLRLDLNKLDMSIELGLQYRTGMALLASTHAEEDLPANQRAQVLNSVGTILAQIVKTQEIVYSMERLKKFEAAMLQAVKMLPKSGRSAFFDLYGSYLEEPNAGS